MLGLRSLVLALLIISFFVSILRAEEQLIFLISPMTSPVSTLSKFQPLAKYLEHRLSKKIVIKQRNNYQKINENLAQNRAHFAYLCTGGYLKGRELYNLEILAIPVINGKKTYQAYVVVHKNSPYQNIEDLKGLTFVFTDPLSLTGHLFIKAYLKKLGASPENFFKKTYFTGSHEKSIEAVARGLADAASIDSLVFEDLKLKGDALIKDLKIIYKSQEFGMPPFVVSPHLSKNEKLKLLQTLLKMNNDPEGKEILRGIGFDRFDPPDHTLYTSAIQILKLIK
ncbi:phosphonate ABC transporter substrate-binding protein [Caldimicrobium thiodismutans]|uniref:Phosphonate ABC transporter substrate-binding protein n=1 Tax=Caldimicrobium thiodismutans TaxID=1653476 RepID=A0A0U5B0Z9_9BACT|nr:phosphate/phosphite/phosphonate ABC transporter substrate-binding protein [Caldimicrobium thiodismutans]BAU23737.1 phosphonate ABC transporter substrate-binding protein [Caldimicrobium thiodismutans]